MTQDTPQHTNRHIELADCFNVAPELAANVEGMSLYLDTIYGGLAPDQTIVVNRLLNDFGSHVASLPSKLQAEGMGLYSSVVFDSLKEHELFESGPVYNLPAEMLLSFLLAAYDRRGLSTAELDKKIDAISGLGINISGCILEEPSSVFYSSSFESPLRQPTTPEGPNYRKGDRSVVVTNGNNSMIITGDDNDANQTNTRIEQNTSGNGNKTIAKINHGTHFGY